MICKYLFSGCLMTFKTAHKVALVITHHMAAPAIFVQKIMLVQNLLCLCLISKIIVNSLIKESLVKNDNLISLLLLNLAKIHLN
jgi:hypothetical protein